MYRFMLMTMLTLWDSIQGSKANKADAMAEIRKRKGYYIANRAEICDITLQYAI